MESEIGFQVRNKASALMSLILFLRNILSTIMDKSPWDSQNVTSILCVSQVLSQKNSAIFLQIHVPSPLPTQYNVERSKELCLDGFNAVCGVRRGGWDVQC